MLRCGAWCPESIGMFPCKEALGGDLFRMGASPTSITVVLHIPATWNI